MNMSPVYERMAEIWMIQRKRKLLKEEEIEMIHCMNANANYFFDKAKIHNLSLVASMTGDTEWQHALCSDIEKLKMNQEG